MGHKPTRGSGDEIRGPTKSCDEYKVYFEYTGHDDPPSDSASNSLDSAPYESTNSIQTPSFSCFNGVSATSGAVGSGTPSGAEGLVVGFDGVGSSNQPRSNTNQVSGLTDEEPDDDLEKIRAKVKEAEEADTQ